MNQKASVILGIDPGTVVTGFGVIQKQQSRLTLLDYGIIRPPPKLTLHQRYVIIFQGINVLLDKHNPSCVSVETQFVKKNVQIAMKLGMARGIIILACALRDIPIHEYAPRKAKQAVVGTGAATKEQVQKMLKVLLNLKEPPEPEDASDALALAICHAHQLTSKACMSI